MRPDDVLWQARRKQLRVGPAKIESNANGASTLGGPGEILKFSFSNIHIWRILGEN